MIRDAARAFVLLVILLYGVALIQQLDEMNEPNFNSNTNAGIVSAERN